MVHPLKALGMPNEQMATWFEIAIKFIDQPFLRGAIEINHDVPAEDQIERCLDGEPLIHEI